jgi:hypothetical protein
VGMLEEAEEEDLAHSRAQKAPEEEEEAWEGGREEGREGGVKGREWMCRPCSHFCLFVGR